jgi:hypothetical protein
MSDRTAALTPSRAVEWPTVRLAMVCYFGAIMALWILPTWAAIIVLAPIIALHASLSH